jgi:hypothetical protein
VTDFVSADGMAARGTIRGTAMPDARVLLTDAWPPDQKRSGLNLKYYEAVLQARAEAERNVRRHNAEKVQNE